MSPSPLGDLVSLISLNVERLESAYKKHGITPPSLDEPFRAGFADKTRTAEFTDAARLIIAAASQLIATVRDAEESIQELSASMYMTSSLGFAVEANIPDILNEVDSQGLHAKEIASKAGANVSRVDGILRYLATRHVFREVTPGVFANNRLSSAIIKQGKTYADIMADPTNKYANAGLAAWVGHVCDEGLKSNTYLSEFLLKSPTVASPFNMGFDTKSTMWEFFEQPENGWRMSRFIATMKHGGDMFKPSAFTDAFPWEDLKDDEVVVDVGGNLGTVTLYLLKAFPHLRYIIQDIEKVAAGATQFWNAHEPDALRTGQVKIQVHDFFQDQPVKGAAVYFTRFIIHNWADDESIKILKQIRAAASSSSKLILFEFCVPHACNTSSEVDVRQASHTLLANLGVAGGGFITALDIQMTNFFNGQERTLEGFTALGDASGWKLDYSKEGFPSAFVFSPIVM